MIAVVLAALASGPAPTPARAATAPTFGAPIVLPSSTGGEPSLAIDTSNCAAASSCHMYIDSPNATANGPAMWASSDNGAHWSAPVPVDNVAPCNPAAGGDTDVDVLPNGSVSAADLDVVWSTIQLSNDHAATFPNCTETAFEDDRPWLAHQGSSTIYVAYHDFVLEVPIVCTSTTASGNSTGTFTCVQAFGTTANPGDAATQLSNCAENTVPARSLLVDPTDKSLNFMYSCSTTAENAAHPPYGPLHDYYMARSTDGITYTTSTIYVAPTSAGQAPNLANIFGNMYSDSAGNYYAVWVGTLDDNKTLENPYHVYMSTCAACATHSGSNWSAPKAIDAGDGLGTHTLAHFAVTSPGNIDLVYYGTSQVGEPNGICGSTGMTHPCTDGATPDGMDFEGTGTNTGGPIAGNWKVYMAQSTNALSASPTFTYSTVDPNYRHFGSICTNGIVCGGASDRHLLDFISVAVDCAGAAHVTYGADQNSATAPPLGDAKRTDGALNTIEVNQTGGLMLAPPATCAAAAVVPEVPLVPLLALIAIGVGATAGRRRRRSSLPSPQS
jgi:hypothetical protein